MSDREESPDWLREFQAPTRSIVTLSSASESSPEVSPRGTNDSHSSHEELEVRHEEKETIQLDSGEDSPAVKTKKTKTTKAQKKPDVEDPLDALKEEPLEENTKEKPVDPPVSSRLPLVFPDKVQRSKALVECDGDSIDLSGDVGAVGRIVVSNDPEGNPEMLLDLKGTIYKSTIVPSRTFCIVSVGQSEAKSFYLHLSIHNLRMERIAQESQVQEAHDKYHQPKTAQIEAIMNDFIKLEPQSNVFEAETMIEGTLEGFSFDSDEEGDKMSKPPANLTDPNNENGDKSNSKKKRKAEKPSKPVKKKAKAAVRPSKTLKKTKPKK